VGPQYGICFIAPRMLKCFLYFWKIYVPLKVCVVKLFVILDVYFFVKDGKDQLD
jgi:hypothetical protein